MQENADFHSTLCDHLSKLLEDDSNLPAQRKLLEALSTKCTYDWLDRQKEAAVDQQVQHATLAHDPEFGLHGIKQASPLPGDLAIMNIQGSSAAGGSTLVPVPLLSGSPKDLAQSPQLLQLARAPAEVAAFQVEPDRALLQAASEPLPPPQLQSTSEQDGMELIGEQGPLETAPDQTSLQMVSGLGRSASHQEPPAEAPPAEISNCMAAVSCANTHTMSGTLPTAPPLPLPGPRDMTAPSFSQLPTAVPAAAVVAHEPASKEWHAAPEAAGVLPACQTVATWYATSSAALNQLPNLMSSVPMGPPEYAGASGHTAAMSAADTQLILAQSSVLHPALAAANSSPDSRAASGGAPAAAYEATPAAPQAAVQTMLSTLPAPPATANSTHMDAMPDRAAHATASAASKAAAASINPASTAAADSWQTPDRDHPWHVTMVPPLASSEGSLRPKHVYAERQHPVAGALSKPLFPHLLHDRNTPWPAASVLAAQHHSSSAGQDPAALMTGDPSRTAQDPPNIRSAPTASASPDVQHRQQANSAAPVRSPTVFSRDQSSTAQAPIGQSSHSACAPPRVTPAARRGSDREASIAQVLASLEGLPQHPLGPTVLSPGGVTPLWKPEVRLQQSTEGELHVPAMQKPQNINAVLLGCVPWPLCCCHCGTATEPFGHGLHPSIVLL